MEIKDKLLKYIREGKYDGLSKAAIDLKCSAPAIWYALRKLEAENKISPQSQYKTN